MRSARGLSSRQGPGSRGGAEPTRNRSSERRPPLPLAGVTQPEDEETREQQWQPPRRSAGTADGSADETSASLRSTPLGEPSAEAAENPPQFVTPDREPVEPSLAAPAPAAAEMESAYGTPTDS